MCRIRFLYHFGKTQSAGRAEKRKFSNSVRLGVACRQRTRLKYSSFLSPLRHPPLLFYFYRSLSLSLLSFGFLSAVRSFEPSDDAFILTRPPSYFPSFLPSFLPSCAGCCHVRFVIQRVRTGGRRRRLAREMLS